MRVSEHVMFVALESTTVLREQRRLALHAGEGGFGVGATEINRKDTRACKLQVTEVKAPKLKSRARSTTQEFTNMSRFSHLWNTCGLPKVLT